MIRVEETATWLRLSGVPKELGHLARAFRYRPEGYIFSPRFTLFKQTDGEKGWDGYVYPLKVDGMTGKLGRGHARKLRFHAETMGIDLEERLIPRPFDVITEDDIDLSLLKAEFEPYPHQIEGVKAWLTHAIGQCQVTVSGGKTFMFALFAAMVKRRFPQSRALYLVPTERLVNQVFKDVRAWLPDWSITQFGGGKRDMTGTDMVVATYASVARNLKRLVMEGWLKSFMTLLVDESHHASSPSLSEIIERSPAFFKVGATDGIGESVEKNVVIEGLLGPIYMEADAAPMIDDGHLAKPHIYVVDIKEWRDKFRDVPHHPPVESPAWVLDAEGTWRKATYMGPARQRNDKGDLVLDKKTGEELLEVGRHTVVLADNGLETDVSSRWCLLERPYDRAIIRFQERNELIRAWATHFSKRGLRTLVVCTRTLHIAILESLLAKELDPGLIQRLYSVHTTKERDRAFDWFRATPGAVLVTPLVKEGVSINEIQAGVIADYISSQSFANQIVGRFIRKKRDGENEAHIVWFKDNQVPTFRRGSARLINWLKLKEGYHIVEPVVGPDSILVSV